MAGLASSSAACFSCILTRSLVRPSTKAAAQGAAIGARFYSEDAGGQSDGQGSGAVTREDGTNGPQKVQMGSEGRPLRRKPRQKAWYKGKLWAQHDELDTRRLISELEELRNYTPIDETVLLKAKKRRFRM